MSWISNHLVITRLISLAEEALHTSTTLTRLRPRIHMELHKEWQPQENMIRRFNLCKPMSQRSLPAREMGWSYLTPPTLTKASSETIMKTEWVSSWISLSPSSRRLSFGLDVPSLESMMAMEELLVQTFWETNFISPLLKTPTFQAIPNLPWKDHS